MSEFLRGDIQAYPDGRGWFAKFPDGEHFTVIDDATDITLAEAMSHRGPPKQMLREYWASGDGALLKRIGKKAAGRLLDGRTHDEFPA